MKKLLFPLILAGATFATNASAADVGIGVSFGDQQTIYVPIELNSEMRLEPFVSHLNSELSTATGSTEITETTIGAGFFGKMKTSSPNVQMYFGGRLGIIRSEITRCTGATCTSGDDNGLLLMPAAGMEYAFDKKFTVGGEVAVFYRDLDSTNDNGTATQVFVRYYF